LDESGGLTLEHLDRQLARIIDHTILRSDATEEDVRRVCREACDYRFAAVVVPPCYVPLAVRATGGKGIPVCSVVSFPFGWDMTEHKLRQTEALLGAGVDEIDVVMNITRFLSGDHEIVRKEAAEITALCGEKRGGQAHHRDRVSERSADHSRRLARCGRGGSLHQDVDRYARRGATVEDVRAIKAAVGDSAGVKASGGIRTRSQAVALADAGATRLGCSASVDVVSAGSQGSSAS